MISKILGLVCRFYNSWLVFRRGLFHGFDFDDGSFAKALGNYIGFSSSKPKRRSCHAPVFLYVGLGIRSMSAVCIQRLLQYMESTYTYISCNTNISHRRYVTINGILYLIHQKIKENNISNVSLSQVRNVNVPNSQVETNPLPNNFKLEKNK